MEIFLIGLNCLQSLCTLFNIKSGTFPTCSPKSHTRANTAFSVPFLWLSAHFKKLCVKIFLNSGKIPYRLKSPTAALYALFTSNRVTFPTYPPKSHTRANTAFSLPFLLLSAYFKIFHVNFPVLLSKIIYTNNHTVSVPFLTCHTISFNYLKQTFNLIKLFFNSSRLILRKNNHTAEKREDGSTMTYGLSKTKAVRFFFSAVILQEKIPYPNSFLSVLNI